MRAPIPSNEADRMDALVGLRVLDSPSDPHLDEIVAMAADLCGTSMAAITLVDGDRVHSIAAHGVTSIDTARDAAFCAHTILGESPLVVADAARDPRFFDSQLVIGLGARFYAGAPLLTAGGHAIGALCVLGHDGRTIDARQLRMLEVLARQAMARIRLDRLVEDHTGVLDDLDMARRNLDYLATHDPLTGLFNRTAITEVLQGLVDANAAGSVATAVLLIDIDNFADVNDTYGHDAGDRVLVTIGDRIHLGARGDDAVARLVGDQFVVVVPNAGTFAPETLARRLLQAIAVPVEHRQAAIAVTASIGVARWDVDAPAPTDLLRRVEAAVRYAKTEGRNRYVVFEDRVADDLSRRLDAHTFVRHVVTQGRMRLDFQPLWSLSTGGVVAHEALLRWDSPGAPTIGPGEFVAVAEQIGLVGEITRFTIHEGCRLAARRRQAGEHDAAVTVNLSSVQLERDEVILVVATALTESGLEPSGLILELTESARLAESGAGQATLRELQEMGVRIALDDVGTGFSSLALLRRFPFDFMKIDRTFVTAATTTDRDVLRTLVQLGHSLGMMVVAEGIEDAELLAQLRSVGCDVAQGYLLGRPGPAEPPHHMASHPLIASLVHRH